MEEQVLFRDYQEVISDDFNNIQAYTQKSLDDIVNDAITASLRYSGLNTTVTGTAEITVGIGRFYGTNANGQVGAVYRSDAPSVISLVAYLPVVNNRILTLVAYGTVDQIDIQTRDYLINVTTQQTEPQAVAMLSSRDCVLAIQPGAENVTPAAPAIPTTQVAVCNILLSPTGIVSVTMLPAQQVKSTENLDGRLSVVEAFDVTVESQVQTLVTDFTTLAGEVGNEQPTLPIIIELVQDVAKIKAYVGLPASYSDYGASYILFADMTQFDINNTQALGFNAYINQGVRFPWQNEAAMALAMFNPLDPNGMLDTGSGLLLPAYTEIVKVTTDVTGTLPTNSNVQVNNNNIVLDPPNSIGQPQAIVSTVALGQYGYQTFTQTEITVPYTRISDGGNFSTCSNGMAGVYGTSNWSYYGDTTASSGGSYASEEPSWLPDFTQYTVVSGVDFNARTSYGDGHQLTTYDYLTIQTWDQDYWTLQAVDHTINGALIAQTMLISSDTWFTKIGIYLATVASETDINFAIALTSNGQPDLTQVIARGTITGANLIANAMNYCDISPTFVSQGTRIAIVITSMANHAAGLVATGSYNGGTFFYSLDGSYFLGDFTKELAVQLWGCEFSTTQATIQLQALNLEGGIRDIDITAMMQIPAACELIFEVQPFGTSAWLPIDQTDPLAPWNNAPVAANFRARFVGTKDIMPGLFLINSLCLIQCPGPAFTFVTMPETLATPSQHITVQMEVQNYNPTPHTFGLQIYTGGPLTVTNPTATTTELIESTPNAVDSGAGTYRFTSTFTLSAAVSSFVIKASGTTNNVADTFLISNFVWWTV